ncbi:MAG: hypothetical protein ACREQV_22135, partial [Candidatus Binatia bacterium]
MSKEHAQAAVNSCFAKGWLHVVEPAWIQEILCRLENQGIWGPTYGEPVPGNVDFTEKGAEVFNGTCREIYGRLVADSGVCMTRTWRHYCLSAERARTLHELSKQCSLWTGPINTMGRWRWTWAQCFSSGYWFDATYSYFDEAIGRPSSEGAERYFELSKSETGIHRVRSLREVIAEHDLDEYEWRLLALCYQGVHREDRLLAKARAAPRWQSGHDDAEGYKRALRACFERELLVRLTAEVQDLIKLQLAADRALGPVLSPFELGNTAIDITPAGAAVYDSVQAAVYGIRLEDSFTVSHSVTERWRNCYSDEDLARGKQESERRRDPLEYQ